MSAKLFRAAACAGVVALLPLLLTAYFSLFLPPPGADAFRRELRSRPTLPSRGVPAARWHIA
jgi:hypothetical protein